MAIKSGKSSSQLKDRINEQYENAPENTSLLGKIIHVLKWAAFIAILTGIIEWLGVLFGVTVLAKGVTLLAFLFAETIKGFLSGLLFATLAEMFGKKKASEIYTDIQSGINKNKEAEIVDEREITVEKNNDVEKPNKIKVESGS